MWCSHCKQDVPSIAAPSGGGPTCGRCKRGSSGSIPAPRPGEADSGIALDDSAAGLRSAIAMVHEDAAELESSRLKWAIRRARATNGIEGISQRALRFDPGVHSAEAQAPARRSTAQAAAARKRPDWSERACQGAAWLMALLGAVLLGLGLGLMGMAALSQQVLAWQWGICSALAGQGLMILGLVQMLASLWQHNRAATQRLVEVHQDLRRLQRATDSMTGVRTGSASACFHDLTDNAAPENVLATVRRQLDSLARRLEPRA